MFSLLFKNVRIPTLIFIAGWLSLNLAFYSVASGGDGTPPNCDKIEFITGDILQGKLQKINSSSAVEFYSALLDTNVTIKPEGIFKLYLDSINRTTNTQSGNSIVRLANEDSFSANFIGFDNDELTVDTWFCGRIKIPRAKLKSFTPSAGAALIFDGPRSVDGWTVHNPGFFVNVIVAGGRQGVIPAQPQPQLPWYYTNNAFYNNGQGAIGRYFQLPEKASIDFDLEWRGNLAFTVFFYSDTLAPYTGRSYMMLFTYRAAYLHRRSPTGITVLGQVEIPEFAKNTKASISIKVDKEQRDIALFVNGKFLKLWKDESDFLGEGNGILFNQQSSSRIKISKIRITRWHGRIDDADSVTNRYSNDIVRLANKDLIEGKILLVSNQLLKIQTDFGKLDIPLERIVSIDFAQQNKEINNQSENLVRGFLSDFGTFSFKIEEMSRDKIIGVSPGIGKLVFLSSSFTLLQFATENSLKSEETKNVFDDFGDTFE